MRLGYVDRCGGPVLYIPKQGEGRESLFAKESTNEYVVRFFNEIKGLGNVRLVRLDGNKQRVIGLRGL